MLLCVDGILHFFYLRHTHRGMTKIKRLHLSFWFARTLNSVVDMLK
jgi:hypothetical protein